MRRVYYPEDFEAAFGITQHDYKSVPGDDGPTWRELCQAAADAANGKYAKVFKPGERVAVYKGEGRTGYRLTGRVTKHPGMHPGQIKVFIDGNEGALSAYPNECIRLVKKRPSILKDLKKENERLKAKLLLLRKYHWGDGTVSRVEVIEALGTEEGE